MKKTNRIIIEGFALIITASVLFVSILETDAQFIDAHILNTNATTIFDDFSDGFVVNITIILLVVSGFIFAILLLFIPKKIVTELKRNEN